MKNSYKVFVIEDEMPVRTKILEEVKDLNWKVSFFSKEDSIFDLLKFGPDILVQDYLKNKVTRIYEWDIPY
jgi:hypothetical protein